jgi:hypothetical protein
VRSHGRRVATANSGTANSASTEYDVATDHDGLRQIAAARWTCNILRRPATPYDIEGQPIPLEPPQRLVEEHKGMRYGRAIFRLLLLLL